MPAIPGGRRCSCSPWPPPARSPGGSWRRSGGGPRPVRQARRTSRSASRSPGCSCRSSRRLLRLLRLRGVAARRLHRARLVGEPAPASSLLVINICRDRHLDLRDARRRPLPLVAARAARPAVRVLCGRARSGSRSIRRTRWSGPAVTGCGNGAIFPLMMTLPLDAADRPEQVAGVVGMMLGIGYCLGAARPARARRAARRHRLVRGRPLGDRAGGGDQPRLRRVVLPAPARARRAH